MTVSAVRLNHAVLFVADLERAVDFYTHTFDNPFASQTAMEVPLDAVGIHADLEGADAVVATSATPADDRR